MFEKLQELVGELNNDLNVKSYTEVKESRRTLKAVRDLAQELRLGMMAKWREAKEVPK